MYIKLQFGRLIWPINDCVENNVSHVWRIGFTSDTFNYHSGIKDQAALNVIA